MARPVGQFNEMKDQTYALLKELAGLGACYATTEFISKRLDRGEKQVQRYLKALRDEGRITILTSKARKDPLTNGFVRRRAVRINAHVGDVKRGWMRKVTVDPDQWCPENFTPDAPPEATDRSATYAALDAFQKAEREKTEVLELLKASDPNAVDEQAALLELQAQLAADGIYMEL